MFGSLRSVASNAIAALEYVNAQRGLDFSVRQCSRPNRHFWHRKQRDSYNLPRATQHRLQTGHVPEITGHVRRNTQLRYPVNTYRDKPHRPCPAARLISTTVPHPPPSALRYPVNTYDGTSWDLAAIKAQLFAGTDANDAINGTASADTINGGLGNDTLYGRSGDDALNGGAGSDTLIGELGNDALDGGAGNDTLNGGSGNNVYLFGKGDGQDSVSYVYDATASKLNTLQFKSGVLASEVTLRQVYDPSFGGSSALEFSIAGTIDKITVSGFFVSDDPTTNPYNPVQQVRFADGTTWDMAAIKAQLFAGTGGADVINGTVSSDTIYGQAGNDVLSGGIGNDMLDGGAGIDSLIGGAGNDAYVMGRGYDADIVQEYDSTVGNTDVLQFMSGVAADQVWFRHLGNDLEVSIIGTNDRATVQNWYLGSQYHVEQFKTSDGKTLLDSKVQDLVNAMASFTPPAVGQTTLPSNYQTSLLPIIAADWGP